jgi:hypothetical protein
MIYDNIQIYYIYKYINLISLYLNYDNRMYFQFQQNKAWVFF